MAKHTPGPWIWGDAYRGLYGAGPNNTVLDHAAYEGMWVAYGPSMDANALLISAAPELLALLVESQESIGGDWRKRRDALIAKATGQCLKGDE